MSGARQRRIAAAGLVWVLCFLRGTATAQTPWAVRDAALRAEVRLQEAPATPDTGTEIRVPDFGVVRAGSGSYALTDADGRPLPVSVTWQGEGRDTLLLARDLQPGQPYYLYIGGSRGVGWNPKTSLLLETRPMGGRGAPPATWGAMQAAWNGGAAQTQGAGFADQIFGGDNPYGEPAFFLSHYSGYLAPINGDLELFTNSADSSFVLVNDQLLTDWTGAPSVNVFEKDVRAKKLPVSATPLKIDYYQAKAGGNMVPNMTLGWRRAGGHLEVVPATAFLHPGKAGVGRYEARDGGPAPVPTVTFESYLGYGGTFLYEVKCRLESGDLPGATLEWRFDDGATAAGPEVTRVMSGTPGTQRVTVAARQGAQSRETTRRIGFYGVPPREEMARRHVHERYVALLMQLDPAKLNAAMLAAALPLLLDDGTDAQAAAYANAWLAHKPDLKDPLWLAAYGAHARAVAQSDPKKAAAEIASNSTARQVYDEALDRLELELLVFQGHDLASLPRVRQIAFRLGPEKGKLGEIRIGDLYRLNGDLARAAEHYRIAQPPEDSNGRRLPAEDQAFALTVEDLLADGAREDAMDKLAKWEVAHPMAKLTTNFVLLRARAVALFGRWHESLSELESFAASHPDSAYELDVSFHRARALYELGRKEEARKVWRELAKNYPKSELAKPSQEWAEKP